MRSQAGARVVLVSITLALLPFVYLGCGTIRSLLGGARAAEPRELATADCAARIDAVVQGLVDAGYHITSRYDPNERRPGMVTARSLGRGLEDLSVTVTCAPRFHYAVAGANVLGLTGKGRLRASTAIDARLEGGVAPFASEETTVPSASARPQGPGGDGGSRPSEKLTPHSITVRARPDVSLASLQEVGIYALQVEIRNRLGRPLIIHPGAVSVAVGSGHTLATVRPDAVGDALALRFHHLRKETLTALAEQQLEPVRLEPGEYTSGILYFDANPTGKIRVRALTDELKEVVLFGEVKRHLQATGAIPAGPTADGD